MLIFILYLYIFIYLINKIFFFFFFKRWLCKFSLNSISECSCVYIEFEQETKICLNINKIIVHDNFYLILDKKNCTIYTCKKNNYEDIGIFYNDHNSKIKNIFCSDKNIFSFGANGKLFDYIKKDKQIERTFCLHKFKYSITCVKYLYSEDSFLYFCVGFNNGVIKIIKMKHLYLDIIYCLKTSNNEIIKIEKSQNSQFISILADEEPYVFFLYKSSNIFMPLGYLKINEAHLKECFYFSYFNSFYILGDNNYFFKIDVKKLEEQIKQEEMSKQVGHSEGNGNGNGNEYINMMEKKKDNKNIYLNDYINDENGDVKKDVLNNNEQQNNSDYDLSVKYEIIKITFNADERNKRLIKRYKNEHNELNMYNKDTNKINNKNDDGNKYGDNEATNIEQEGMEEFFEEMEGLENESDNEYKESNSSSNLSDNTYNKMNFYREKINLTQNMQDLHSDNNKDIFILKNKKKNLKRYIEILFHNKTIKNKRYENNDELPKNMLSLYLERDNRKIIYKEERNTKNNNINIDHHNNNNNGDNMNYARLKHDTINICCVTKSKKNRGFFIATQGVKNNYLFFLNLDKKDIIKYKYTDSKEDTHIDIIMPRIIYKIDNKNFLPKRTYIYKMIINEIKDLLFCLTNNNEIYIFSIKFFFLYYYIKIPVYEKVRNIFINNKNATTTSNNNNNMKKNNNMNNNFQYIFICLNNNKYIQLNFNYPFFYLLNVIKRYHINIKKFMHSFMIPNKMFLSYDSIHQYFIEEIHDYIVEEFIKKRKKKTNLMPFKYEDITDDLNFIIELLEIHNEEEKKNNQEKDDKHAQGQNEKNKNDITDIWDFIQQNKKEQEEEIEEQKKKIDLILNYDQKNISTFFNINSNNMKDVDIQYSLRDTKEYQRNEEKFRKALLYKQHIHMKINKLKKKYIKLNKRNKFLIDLDYSHYIYEMLQQNIQEIKNVFMYHEQEYDNRIKYLSNKFIRLRYIKNPIYAFNDKNHFYAKSLKMYLKNYTFKKKNRKITTKEKKIKEPKQTLELTTEIKDCLQNFNELRERNKNVKIINNEEKIEEICIKKKIIKMYEEMLLKLEKMSEERKEMDEPRKIKHIRL